MKGAKGGEAMGAKGKKAWPRAARKLLCAKGGNKGAMGDMERTHVSGMLQVRFRLLHSGSKVRARRWSTSSKGEVHGIGLS
jgi:hypothetical protein